ncbi:hypothetical protein [Flavobacterium sp.]|uniref:hypothetical protein n=1 Tax=Flavobacterium sp. TaxID=239 RepID=UPI003529176A
MKEKIYKLSPHFFQNLLITIFNVIAYKKRYGGSYHEWRNTLLKNRSLSFVELQNVQNKRYKSFIKNSIANSKFYREKYKNIKNVDDLALIQNLPIINKEEVRSNINDIIIKTKDKFEISKTGGTTGKSLQVKFTYSNMQERFAFLDDFRSRFGYELGKKTAWFSGKGLLTDRDIKRNRFWKTDIYHNVRYYSTFHIKDEYLGFYISNLILYQP